MSEKGDQVQRLLSALAKHGDLVAEAFEGAISGGDKQRNAAIETLTHLNALKPYDEDRYTLNPRLREFIADNLSSFQVLQALRQVSPVMRHVRELWTELRRLKLSGAVRDMYRVESALDESVVDIAYSIENNISILHSLISTQYGNVENLGSKLRQNKFYEKQVNIFLKDVSAIDALVELIGDEATAAGMPHIRHLVVRRLGSRRLQWTSYIKDAQAAISKRLMDARLMEVRMKRLSQFALWLTRNKTTDGWDLNVNESAPTGLFRPEPIDISPQPDVSDSDPEIVKSLLAAMERMPLKVSTTSASTDQEPQMMIVDDDDEPFQSMEPQQIALGELLVSAATAIQPISLVAWKQSRAALEDVPDQAWLMYACTQLFDTGLRINFVGDSALDPFSMNESFHDIEVCSAGQS